MSSGVKLPGYILESVISEDTYLTHYSAVDESGQRCVITEFAPRFMINRTDGGLTIEDRFADEFNALKEKFHLSADSFRDMADPEFAEIDDVVSENNTVYAVRKMNETPGMFDYLSGKRMKYDEVYLFLRPLLMSFAQAERFNLVFRFNENDLRVNRYGQLTLDKIFSWEESFRSTITDVINLYYRLVYGRPYVKNQTDEDAEGIEVPQKLLDLMLEVLNGDVLYGSMDDFYKKLKSVVGIKTERPGGEGGGANSILKGAIAALSLLVFFGGVFVFLFNVAIPIINKANPRLADETFFAAPARLGSDEPVSRNFSAFAVTAPEDPGDILNGSFIINDGVEYFRAFKDGFKLVKRDASGNETVLVSDARPAFLIHREGNIYYSDGLSNYAVYMVGENGGTPRLITGDCASHISIAGRFLYYTNHDDRDRLYRIDLETLEPEMVLNVAAYGAVAHGERIYFINGNDNFNLYSVDARGGSAAPEKIYEANADNLRVRGNDLYILDLETGEIISVTPNGDAKALALPYKVRSFEIFGPWMVIVEEDTFHLYAYNVENGTRNTLEAGRRTAFAVMADEVVYSIDFYNSRMVRRFVKQ